MSTPQPSNAQPPRPPFWQPAAQRLQAQAQSAWSSAWSQTRSSWTRFWKSFGGWKPQSKLAFGIGVGCAGIVALCAVCSVGTAALASALPPVPTQPIGSRAAATATTPQQIVASSDATATTSVATATTIPSPSATAKPTLVPTKTPAPVPTKPPAPTKPPCANPCNPWGYNFTPGNLIYSPPGNFCSYFACIANFWNGNGYVMECQDATFSKSGGISGSCSHHGGNWRPLYSH